MDEVLLEETLLLAKAEPVRLAVPGTLLCTGALEPAELISADCSDSAATVRLAVLCVLAAKLVLVPATAEVPLWHPQAPSASPRLITAANKNRQIFAKFNKSPQ